MIEVGPSPAIARVRTALARSDDPRTDGQLLQAFRDRREPDEAEPEMGTLPLLPEKAFEAHCG